MFGCSFCKIMYDGYGDKCPSCGNRGEEETFKNVCDYTSFWERKITTREEAKNKYPELF